jgi:WD40 repeat protein
MGLCIRRADRSCGGVLVAVRRAALSLLVLVCASASAHAQGRADIVWMRGGHAFGITGLRYTPDGSRIVSTGRDGTIKIFKTADGMLERTIRAFSLKADVLALSPDGQLIAAFGADRPNALGTQDFGAVRLYRLSDGALLREVTRLTINYVSPALAFSPDGQTVVTSFFTNAPLGLQFWRVSDGALVKTLTANYPGFVGVTFSPDGQTLATTASAKLLHISASDGAVVRDYGTGTGYLAPAAFSPNGALIANASGVYRTTDGVKVLSLPSPADHVVFSADGSKLAAGSSGDVTNSEQGHIRIWSTANWTLLQDVKGHDTTSAVIVAFSPDSLKLASAANEIREWRVSDAALLQTLTPSRGYQDSVAFSPDGQVLAAGTALATGEAPDTAIRLWRASDGTLLNTIDNGTQVTAVKYSPDGKLFASGSGDCTMKLWNADGSFRRAVLMRNGCNDSGTSGDLIFTNDSAAVFATAGGSSTDAVRLYRVADGSVVRSYFRPGGCGSVSCYLTPGSVALSPDGTTLAVAGGRPTGAQFESVGAVQLFNATTGAYLRELPLDPGANRLPLSVAFSPDGLTIAAGSGEQIGVTVLGGQGAVRVWRTSDGALLHLLLGHTGQVRTVTFSPNGQTITSGGDDGALRVWRASDGTLLQTFDQETGSIMPAYYKVLSVAYSPDGSRFAYGRADATIVVARPSAGSTCNYSAAPLQAGFPAAASTGSIAISAATGCAWSATSDGGWVTITSGASGTGAGTVQYSVAANTASTSRAATITAAGQSVSVQQGGMFCVYGLNKNAMAFSSGGGSGVVSVSAPSGCTWAASSSVPWIHVLTRAIGTASDTFEFVVPANTTTGGRSGTLTVSGQTLSISQDAGCGFTVSPLSAGVAGISTSGAVTVTASGTSCPWTATSNASWLTINSGASGSTSGSVTYTVAANNGPTRSGTLTIAGFTHTVTQAPQTPAPAFGTLDTPLNNTLGLSGSIAVTGWALDDVEVTEVQVWRDPHPSDPPGAVFGGPAPQGGKVFVGYASLVNGARPDVETLYPTYPFKSRAGWGYLLLTRGLIWDGKGPFKLYAIAKDQEGHLSQLGSTTISIANASATKPFGAIDTPGQGATARGLYPNTGWVLTPNAGALIGADKVQVAIDGVFLPGTPSMSDRTDISSGFSQFNTTGAGRGLFIDTTQYSDGAHTIGWLVTDSGGKADGVGSRFFTVANSTSALTVAGAEPSARDLDGLPLDASALRMRRGWDADADLSFVDADAAGRIVLAGEELDRIEVRLDELGDSTWHGYLRVGDELRALPIGSHLDARGTFTWQPGVGFLGTYDLVFVRTAAGVTTSRRDVRIVLQPQGRARTPQVIIDTPGAAADLPASFTVAGWALDPRAPAGTGIDAVHVWAYPSSQVTLAHADRASADFLTSRSTADRPDDVTGSQIHVVYVLPQDGVDGQLDVNGTIADSMASAQAWLRNQNGGHGLRLDTRTGELDVTFFRLSRTDAALQAFGGYMGYELQSEMKAAGLLTPGKVYLLYYGGGSSYSCGGSAAWPPELPGQVAALYLNGAVPGYLPCSANQFRAASAAPAYWEFAALHEVMHTMGIVPRCAPHHVLNGHVGDDPRDLMYAGPLPWAPSILDVNKDDYLTPSAAGCPALSQSSYIEESVNFGPSITSHPVSVSVAAGGTATFSAAAAGTPVPTVQWQVSTNSGSTFTNISSATSTTYSFTAALGDSGKQYRAVFTNSVGTATSNAATLTVTVPTMSLDKTTLVFSALTSGAAFTSQTSAQTVRLTQTGAGTVTWTAASTTPWLVVSPTSGSGSTTLTIATQFASGLTATQTGTITLAFTGASNTAGPIAVTLTVVSSTAAVSPPFGVFDTPVGDATVLAGSIAMTGWTLDNVGVQRVELWRDLQPGETTPPFASTPSDPRTGKVFIANATFVDGARPDVEALYPTTPFKYRAGWGYLLLTWGLWNQGNGTYRLYAYAFDQENNLGTIGTKTVIVSNTAATKPFGSIDTPAIGGDASGPNFGWGLTPKVNGVATCKIPPSGVQVSIDSGPLQPVVYGGDVRADIAGAFTGFSNSAAAGGHYIFDWTTLTNGAHTIGWLITDDCNRADGVGSRFFNVSTGRLIAGSITETIAPGASVVASVPGLSAVEGSRAEAGLPESTEPITVARGYGELPEIVTPGEAGSRTIDVKQGERIEVRLPRGYETAYQLVGGQRRPLPTGATWDTASGTFYWQPAAGFLGRYRIVFSNGGERISVRVVVVP